MGDLVQDHAGEVNLTGRGIAIRSKVPVEGAAVGAVDIRLSRIQIAAVQGVGDWYGVPGVGHGRPREIPNEIIGSAVSQHPGGQVVRPAGVNRDGSGRL